MMLGVMRGKGGSKSLGEKGRGGKLGEGKGVWRNAGGKERVGRGAEGRERGGKGCWGRERGGGVLGKRKGLVMGGVIEGDVIGEVGKGREERKKGKEVEYKNDKKEKDKMIKQNT